MSNTQVVARRRALLDACELRARILAWHVQQMHQAMRAEPSNHWVEDDSRGDWERIDWLRILGDTRFMDLPVPTQFVKDSDGTEWVRVTFSDHVWIDFGNLRGYPDRDANVQVLPPVVKDVRTVATNSAVLTNATDTPIHRSRTFEDSESTSDASQVAQALAIKASASFSALIGTGAASPVKAEAKITASVETAINRSSQNTETDTKGDTDSGSWSGDIPPHTEFDVVRVAEVGSASQTVVIDGDLDMSVRIHASLYGADWDSLDELAQVMSGVAAQRGPQWQGNWASVYVDYPGDRWADPAWLPDENGQWKEAPFTDLVDRLSEPITARAEVTHEFDSTQNTRFTWTSKPIGQDTESE